MHKKILRYLICCCTLGILFFCPISATAQTLEISPSAFYIEGSYGDLILKNIDFTNTAPVAVNVTITTDLDDIYLATDDFSIPAFGSKSLPIGFLILDEQIGWITYDIGTSTYNQLVFIEMNTSETDIHIFPGTPTAGDKVVFLDMSDDKYDDTYGVVYISSTAQSYLLNMQNGIGSINLSENDHGNAFVKISNGGKSTYKEFTIEELVNGDTPSNDDVDTNIQPKVICPSTVNYGEIKDISVQLGNKTGVNKRILITRPSGFSYEGVTNSFGRLSIEFNEVGQWQFTVLIDSEPVTGETKVNKITENPKLKTTEPESDNMITIEVFDDAYVTVTGPSFSDEGVEHGGQYSFTPENPGEYLIEAESSSKTGTLSVTVNCQPQIVIVDADNGKNVVGTATTEKSYYIKLLDNNRDPIAVNEDIKIYDVSDPYSEPFSIPMVDETAYWTPYDESTYRIEFPGDGFYSSTQTHMATTPLETSPYINDWIIFILIIAAVLVLAYLYFSGKYKVVRQRIKDRRDRKHGEKPTTNPYKDPIHKQIDEKIHM